jgi:hypothetical protein
VTDATERPAEQITLTNIVVQEGSRGRYKVSGEATNNSRAELSAILAATFYDASGRVMGSASGSVNRLAARQAKTFWLRVSNDVSGYAVMKVHVDCVL